MTDAAQHGASAEQSKTAGFEKDMDLSLGFGAT